VRQIEDKGPSVRQRRDDGDRCDTESSPARTVGVAVESVRHQFPKYERKRPAIVRLRAQCIGCCYIGQMGVCRVFQLFLDTWHGNAQPSCRKLVIVPLR